jgi:predicted kinase
MKKLIIMRGLPAAGKSSKAAEIMKADGNCVRINKDLLRKMLHFNKWSGKNEGLTRDAARMLARGFLEQGKVVIIDDTNLNSGTVESWIDLVSKYPDGVLEYVDMETSMEECLKRDQGRQDEVGEAVIKQMALSSGLFPKPAKGFVLCDLDGTLCDIEHRRHYVQGEKKDWKGFFAHMMEDKPRMEVLDMLLRYEDEGYDIIFVSGRPDTYRAFTEDWLEKHLHGYKLHKALLMRRADDKRPDTEVKKQILDNCFLKHKYPIHVVIDDRPSVISMWRDNGLEVIDVGDGVPF